MKVEYDKYYKTENYFGAAYPELVNFYSSFKQKGKLLDLGCGQGRDAIALAELGFEVLGIDNSKVGIEQLNKIAKEKALSLIGIVGDIYEYTNLDKFDFILLDSMFHFGKKDIDKETALLKRIFNLSKQNCNITICIQNTGKKEQILNSIIMKNSKIRITNRDSFDYTFEDKSTNHKSITKYIMVTVNKVE